MRLIDADELLDVIKQLEVSAGLVGVDWVIKDVVPKIINEQPTIDLNSIMPHGKWINDYCSNCNAWKPTVIVNGLKLEPKYCPECGAKMDLEV